MNASLSASVVIPTRQRRASLERALRALARQTVSPGAFEVIVAIDGSQDGTREMVAGFPAPHVLRAVSLAGRGRAAACNAGARAAAGRLLVLLDDDMEPLPGFLAAHLDAHPPGSRRGVVGAVPISVRPDSPPVVAYVGGKFNRHLERLGRPGYEMTFRDFYTGNFSVARDLFDQVGGFDEEFRVYGNEDGELALRLIRAGVELLYCPSAAAEQHYEKDFAALARDNIAKGRTAVLCARKAPEALPQLKLAHYDRGSRKWRLARAGLLALSRALSGVPDRVIRFVERIERRKSPRLESYYALALDYFYWLGARAELLEGRRSGPGSAAARKTSGKHPDATNRPALHR